MLNLDGKTALITGAAQGIGSAIAELFALRGASVILLDINQEGVAHTAQRISRSVESHVIQVVADVSNRESVRQAFCGGAIPCQLDILVNNAGKNIFSEPLKLSDTEWEDCFQLNLSAAWYCAQAVLPGMVEKNSGSIINIASVHAHRIIRGTFPYPVFKHGMLGLTRSLSIENAKHGIRVNSISPGLIDTESSQAYFRSFADPAAIQSELVSRIPVGRIGTAADVAITALFLASERSSFINGADIVVDGGCSNVYAGE